MEKTKVAGFWFVVAIVFTALVLAASVQKSAVTYDEPLPAPLPDVTIEGWTNTKTGPTVADLEGKWVLVDCWDTTCMPCVAMMPELVAFQSRWPDVVVIGVTAETSASMQYIDRVVEQTPGMSWPIAYGGSSYMNYYGVRMIPSFMLYDPSGELILAKSHSLPEIESLIGDPVTPVEP